MAMKTKSKPAKKPAGKKPAGRVAAKSAKPATGRNGQGAKLAGKGSKRVYFFGNGKAEGNAR